jgi:hypothetical protein
MEKGFRDMGPRRWILAVVLFVALLGVGTAIGWRLYDIGYNHGLAHNGTATVVLRDSGFHGGFFPFGIFFIPLFFFLFFGLCRLIFWRGMWGGGYGPRRFDDGQPFSQERRDRFAEWHRRQHESMADPNPPPGTPSS